MSRSTSLTAGIAFVLLATGVCALPACAAESDEDVAGDAQSVVTGIQISNDATNAYYKIPYSTTPTWVRLFLDTDQSSGTGYPLAGIGANYLIENGNLYRYSGSGGSWAWTYIKKVSANTVSGGTASVTVARADLGSPGALDLVVKLDADTSAKLTQTFSDAGSAPAPAPSPTDPATPTGQITYAPSSATIFNPERGFYHQIDMTNPVSLTQLQNYRNNGDSLILADFNLIKFVSSPIDSTTLGLYQNQLNTVRAAGLKAVVRFVYANTDTGLDATPTQMQAHMDQLSPLLNNNKDVVTVVQAGFIGSWGEWGNSVHFNSVPTINRKVITDKLLQVVPTDRMLQLRTPYFKRTLYGSSALGASEGYTGTARARIGHHNDCFLASSNDMGTYTNITDDYAYLSADSAYTPVGGETCRVNAPRTDCGTALAEMQKFHWSFIHMDYNADVVNGWKSQGCFDTIKQKVGYRFTLQSGSYSTSGKPGGAFSVGFTVQNQGWSAPFNPRDVELVLRNTSTGAVFRVKMAADPRKWAPGQTTTVNETVTLPANIPSGTYALLLNLPDPVASVHTRPEYSIQLANTNTWEASTGFNNLNRSVTIAP